MVHLGVTEIQAVCMKVVTKKLKRKTPHVLEWVCRAYRTGEIPAQSHVRLGVFFSENPRNHLDAKELIDVQFSTDKQLVRTQDPPDTAKLRCKPILSVLDPTIGCFY